MYNESHYYDALFFLEYIEAQRYRYIKSTFIPVAQSNLTTFMWIAQSSDQQQSHIVMTCLSGLRNPAETKLISNFPAFICLFFGLR
jgi:hypothetical protein